MSDSPLTVLAYLRMFAKGALFRPSNAKTWLNCPGHVRLAASAPAGRGSGYAREGSAAHVMAAHALRGERQPLEWTDRLIPLGAKGEQGWVADAEMVENVEFYCQVVSDRLTPTSEMLIEHELSLQPLDPSEPLLGENRGTADVVLVDRVERRLTIIDLKYGRGIPVPADAPQLRNYALMGLVGFPPPPGGWREVVLVVVQPRTEDETLRVKIVVFNPNVLLEFAGVIYGAMMAALAPDPPLRPDPQGGQRLLSWCYFCAAKANCPALRNAALAVGIEAFALVPLHPPTASTKLPAELLPAVVITPPGREHGMDGEGTYHLINPADLSGEQVATVLNRSDAWDIWITAVKERAVDLLIASPTTVPGWKMVARTGNRKYNPALDPADIAIAARRFGLQMAEIYTEPKLKSPAQLEKLLPKGVDLDAVQEQLRSDKNNPALDLIVRGVGEPTLTRDDNPKPALAGVFSQLPRIS